jgi:hypothetical protein
VDPAFPDAWTKPPFLAAIKNWVQEGAELGRYVIVRIADSDGRVFCFNIASGEVTKRPPKRAASASGFNDFLIDGAMVSFEDKLEKIETSAAPIIKRIVRHQSLAGLSAKERQRVAEFIAVQSFRTKAFYAGMSDRLDRQAFGRTFERLLESLFITTGEIAARQWALLVIRYDDVFYLGDNPVALQWTETPGAGGSLGFDVKGVEAYLPLSPKCALYMPCRVTSGEILKGHETALQLHRAVRAAALRGWPGGSRELQLAQRTIRTTYPLYTAFTTGAPIEADAPNIECVNSLQCLYSHGALYSNRLDFTFAKRVFSQSPSYRGAQKTSLLEMNILVPGANAGP